MSSSKDSSHEVSTAELDHNEHLSDLKESQRKYEEGKRMLKEAIFTRLEELDDEEPSFQGENKGQIKWTMADQQRQVDIAVGKTREVAYQFCRDGYNPKTSLPDNLRKLSDEGLEVVIESVKLHLAFAIHHFGIDKLKKTIPRPLAGVEILDGDSSDEINSKLQKNTELYEFIYQAYNHFHDIYELPHHDDLVIQPPDDLFRLDGDKTDKKAKKKKEKKEKKHKKHKKDKKKHKKRGVKRARE